MKLNRFLKNTAFAALALALSLNAQADELKIAVLPAADSILLYAAEAQGYFTKEGLEVKLVPFRSAIEIGAAMRSGNLSGHYGDLMNVLTQNATGAPQAVVATMTRATPEERTFAFVTKPGSNIASLTDLKGANGVTTAMSASTIIDYLLDRMSSTERIPAAALKRTEVRQIPIRVQLLLSGKVETALLPEPLASLVVAKGGRALWDDRTLNEPLAVVALKKSELDPDKVAHFRSALSQAARAIDAEPEKFRALMVQKGLLTKEAAAGFRMPVYKRYGTADNLAPLPTAEDISRVGAWMVERGMLKTLPNPEDLVAR